MDVVLVLLGCRCFVPRELGWRTFTENWTMRIAKCPPNITISSDAPLIRKRDGNRDILQRLKDGINIKSVTTLSNAKPCSKQMFCFHVFISKKGVSAPHAASRIVSKTVASQSLHLALHYSLLLRCCRVRFPELPSSCTHVRRNGAHDLYVDCPWSLQNRSFTRWLMIGRLL